MAIILESHKGGLWWWPGGAEKIFYLGSFNVPFLIRVLVCTQSSVGIHGA